MSELVIKVGLPDEQIALLESIKVQNELILKGLSTDVWMDDEGVSARFGVSKSLITKWRKEMALPFSQIGEVRRYNAKEVDEWFKKYSNIKILKAA